ncbi:MAG: decaprenyl-phosphate phosphoribosyltransferase [Candidatus Shapirobacteria bacterium]|nr:decaprenyl-phosphate phosphoribosyltransferase [Candidatus Shapirobacteria bacterium]
MKLKMIKNDIKFKAVFEALRPNQWIKNLNLFAATILNGQLFNSTIFIDSFLGFIVFCFLSSSSYLINDVADIQKDRLHPVKKNRPIARGDVSEQTAVVTSLFLLFTGLFIAIFINFGFFIISLIFIILQYLYSFIIKKKAVFDIISIAIFFIIRAYAGEIATGYHLPVWIMLAVIFLSLFIASGKRRSELVNRGSKSRTALEGYSRSLLNFYTTMFAVCTLIAYALYTFFAEQLSFQGLIHSFLSENYPSVLDRKWYMITLLPVIFGIMRYGQIIFEMQEGERPERIIATDIPLLVSVMIWGLMMIAIVYAL